MRSSLVVSGGIISLTGVALFVALDGWAWLALIGGGAVVLAAGFFLEEMPDRVELMQPLADDTASAVRH